MYCRYWEAIKKWDGALDLNPKDETVYEMKAQVSTVVQEYNAKTNVRSCIH